MSNNLAVVLLAGGVVAYELVNRKGEIVGASGTNATPPVVSGTSRPKGIRTAVNTGTVSGSYRTGAYQDATPSPGKTIVTGDGGSMGGDLARDELQAKLEAAAKEAYDKLSCDAKKAGAKKLNAQFPTLHLPEDDKACEMSAHDVLKACVDAGMVAAGYAVCGPVCGAIGGMLAAYCGEDVTNYIELFWGTVYDKVGDAYGTAWDTVSDEVSSWF